MAATNKRPLLSIASPVPAQIRNLDSETSHTQQMPGLSLPALPRFLTLPLSTLHQKFRLLTQHEAVLRVPNAILSHPLAVSRNRYPDVHPWSHNRVQLQELKFPYINASPIDLGRPNEKFIATQGPVGTYRDPSADRGPVADVEGKIVKDGTGGGVAGNIGFGHFWEMVWQEDVEVLIMLTRCVEKGAEKCGVYYPEAVGETLELEGEEDVWGAVTCETFKLEWETEIRELKLMKRKGKADLNQDAEVDGSIQVEERKIWHFLFLGWPDHDVPQTPEDRKALLELIRMTRFRINAGIDHESEPQEHPQPLETLSPNPSSQAKSKPRIVHCSAGVGRTGTFIALDHLLQELEEGRFDDMAGETDDHDPVFECVKRLREQRMYMVYKPAQYFYIYQTLREMWNVHCTKVVSKIND